MKKDIAYLLLISLVLAGFGYFYLKEYYPLDNKLKKYREENRTLIKVINDLKEESSKGDTLKEEPTRNYVAQDIRDMIEGIEVEQAQEEISITLPGKKLFPPGSVELSDEGREMLLKLANILKGMGDREIRIEGHTDNTKISGSLKKKFPSNWDLSAQRAVNVVKYLISEVGIDPNRLSAVAYGEYRPVAPNASASGRARNRRIVIDVLPR